VKNTSATGGYAQPTPQPPTLVTVPQGLTFIDFLQTVLVGLSGVPGPYVRPEWQQQPPKRPTVDQTWIAFGIEGVSPDFNTYMGQDQNGNEYMQQNELVGLSVSFYGPNSYDLYGLVRDNLQLPQNLSALSAANVGYAYDTPAQHVPDLINEIWYDRWRAVFYFRRQIQRFYPVLTFSGASGTIYANAASSDTTVVPFTTGEE